ncbi:MAG: efflux RND transporter periplasmic adaptor subunit [Caulobacterales bacterium]
MDRPVQRPPWRRKPAMIAMGAVGALAAAAVAASLISAASVSQVRVPAATVTLDMAQEAVFHDFVPLKAKAVPKDVVYLDALDGGQIAEVLAQPGDMVVAGQPLIKFRNTELELDVLDREGRLVESITQLQSYEKQLEETRVANARSAAEIDYNIVRLTRSAQRRDTLLAKGFLPRETADQVHDELTYDERLRPLQDKSNRQQEALRLSQLPQIEAELKTLRESLAITRGKLDNLVLRAPVAGKLTDTELEVGQIRKPGERLGEIVPPTGFKVQADIDEYYLGRVRPGQTADIEIGDQRYNLTVTRVDPQVKDATFRVELAFAGAQPPNLLPGEALEGKLSVGGDRQALVLPAGPFLERSGGDWVMVASADGGHADKRRIRLGARNTDQVEVLSGLKPGERVITSDYAAFEKVDRVQLAK